MASNEKTQKAREIAVELVKKNPDGIKLNAVVEHVCSKVTDMPAKAVRAAVGCLQTKFPDVIERSGRGVYKPKTSVAAPEPTPAAN